ncbi:OmpA family protein [Leptospira broomii serovar Hurstbridge str. 5399]|uniref:OmpA family protein n=1 Tax=Leptospira broomii serovar Hurstbridge str. 5399 TaxID=1049789 RepID=T0EYQ2_9LEPT|nr:OmpA family protein [Leptospira broomii]EQA43995.1 OmpA family protein [Leptospira broomii serovar Hurstbridge str. 5399]
MYSRIRTVYSASILFVSNSLIHKDFGSFASLSKLVLSRLSARLGKLSRVLLICIIVSALSNLNSQENKERKPEKLKGGINTSLNEFGISLSDDGNTLYYYSKRNNSNYTDIYKSVRNGNLWSAGLELSELNSQFDDQSPFVLNKEEGILFSSNRDGSIEFILPNGKIGVSRDIYFSKKGEGKWLRPTSLPTTVNTSAIEENPYLYENRLYFTRYPFGVVGESDIFVSEYSDKTWNKAYRLPSPINTDYAEIATTIGRDGNTLYFSSNRPGGFGGMDIYKSTRNPDGSYTEPINLGPMINSKGDEAFYVEAPDGKNAYFCRREESSNYDIYEIEATPSWDDLKTGKKISIEAIHFQSGSFELENDSKPSLDHLVEFLSTNGKSKLKITGHTDLHGETQDNMVLSRRRAESVRSYLIHKGISPDRIETEGKGSTEPIFQDKNPETDRKNRRTEFQLLE